MEIVIMVVHEDGTSIVRETKTIPMEEYDALSYPEDMLHAKIWEMRNKITQEVMRRDRIKETQVNCQHNEWEPSGGKWTSVTQRRCINCGLIKD